jgi:hypothetical protein
MVVCECIEGMARHRGLALGQVEIDMITAPVLRLDRDWDRTQLLEIMKWLQPQLLLLDPLVRLHGIDENHACEVAELLTDFLARSSGSSISRSCWCTTRERTLLSEHRTAPASPSVCPELVATNAEVTHLEIITDFGELSRAELQDEKERGLKEQIARPSGPRSGAHANEAARYWRLRTSIRRGAGVARAGRSGRPHAPWLATSQLIIEGVSFSFPIERKGTERSLSTNPRNLRVRNKSARCPTSTEFV